MRLRPLGIVLSIIGIVMIIYTGFNYVTTEKVVDLGPIKINAEKNHPVQWSPIVGIALLVGGIVIVLSDKKVKAWKTVFPLECVNCVTYLQSCVTFSGKIYRTFGRNGFKTIKQLKLYIKYMVSNRCKIAVKDELKKLGLHFILVDLGEVEIMESLSAEKREQTKIALFNAGFELMDDKRAVLIERIKNTIIEMVHHTDELIKTNFSIYLSEKLNHDYTYLANLFSEVQGTTIEQFIISHKIERIKELIIYGEQNITEIAWRMNYSSVAHLSNQFKKATGLSPSHFKQLKDKRRSPIEDIGKAGDDRIIKN